VAVIETPMPTNTLVPRVAARHARRADELPGGDLGVLQRRLERIADRGRELLLRATNEPTFSHAKLLKGIATLVALAERDLPSAED
jgi:hypothetical protein